MVEQRVGGFSVVTPVRGTSCELDGLFVEPDLMRQGIGRALIDDVVERLQPIGVVRLDVDRESDGGCVLRQARLRAWRGCDDPVRSGLLDVTQPSGCARLVTAV